MEEEKTYTADDIPEWEAKLSASRAHPLTRSDEWTGNVESPYPGIGRESRRLQLTVDALKAGLTVQHVFDGLLLDGEIVLATSTNKWRFAHHEMSWHRYATVGEVLIVAKGGLLHEAHGRIPEMPEIRACLRGLLKAMGLPVGSYDLPEEPRAAWESVRKLALEHERIKAAGALPPTAQQLRTARIIGNARGIYLPALQTRDAANRFIDAHTAQSKPGPEGGPGNASVADIGSSADTTQKRLPDYGRLRRVVVPASALLALDVSSVDHLVARVNAIRVLADRPHVSRQQFPYSLANFRALAGEMLGATRTPGDPSVSGPVPEAWFVTTETGGPEDGRSYDPDTPLIDFVNDNLDLLPARQRIAVDRRFYVNGTWKGYGMLGRELDVSDKEAETLFDVGFAALGKVTGCWDRLRRAILGSRGRPPITLAEMEDQPWTAGLPTVAVLMVGEKAAGLRLVAVEGHGDYLLRLKDSEIRRFIAAMKASYPKLVSQRDADELLRRFHAMFGGRIDAAVRHMLGY